MIWWQNGQHQLLADMVKHENCTIGQPFTGHPTVSCIIYPPFMACWPTGRHSNLPCWPPHQPTHCTVSWLVVIWTFSVGCPISPTHPTVGHPISPTHPTVGHPIKPIFKIHYQLIIHSLEANILLITFHWFISVSANSLLALLCYVVGHICWTIANAYNVKSTVWSVTVKVTEHTAMPTPGGYLLEYQANPIASPRQYSVLNQVNSCLHQVDIPANP